MLIRENSKMPILLSAKASLHLFNKNPY